MACYRTPYLFVLTPFASGHKKTTAGSSVALSLRHCPLRHCQLRHFATAEAGTCSCVAKACICFRFAGSVGAGSVGAGYAIAYSIASLLHPAKPTHQKPIYFLYNLSRSPPFGVAYRQHNVYAHFVRFGCIVSSGGGGGGGRVYCCNQCLHL